MIVHCQLAVVSNYRGSNPPNPPFQRGDRAGHHERFGGLSSNCLVFEGLAGAPGQARGHCPYVCGKASCFHAFRSPRGLMIVHCQLAVVSNYRGSNPPNPPFQRGDRAGHHERFGGLSSNCLVFEGLAEAPGQARGHCPYVRSKRVAFIRFVRPADVCLLTMSGCLVRVKDNRKAQGGSGAHEDIGVRKFTLSQTVVSVSEGCNTWAGECNR